LDLFNYIINYQIDSQVLRKSNGFLVGFFIIASTDLSLRLIKDQLS